MPQVPSDATSIVPTTVSSARPVEVRLHDQATALPTNWSQTLSIGYGETAQTVGLTRGGTVSAEVFYGADSAAAVDETSWWIVDTPNDRVVLVVDNEITTSARIDMEITKLQQGDVTASGDFIAATKPQPVLIRRVSGLLEETFGDMAFARPVGGSVTETGTFTTFSCESESDRIVLQAAPPIDGAILRSLVEGLCSPEGVLHLLWYGYWSWADGDVLDVSSYLRIEPGGQVTSEPTGPLASERDPGTPARLSLTTTGKPALSATTLRGVEGWIRTSDVGLTE